MTLEELNAIAHANRMYCAYAKTRIAMPVDAYSNHQFYAEGVLVFDMDSLEVSHSWGSANAGIGVPLRRP